jgi:hypothetical protein
MLREMLLGTVTGALGTVALNAATCADMAVRARPSSSVPAEVASTLAEKVGVDLGSDETEQNLKSGLGALSGYVVGLGVGTTYGSVRPHLGRASKMRAGVVLGLAAMAGSDVPAAALGVTSPAEWDANSWLSDIVPHLAYGLTTTLA